MIDRETKEPRKFAYRQIGLRNKEEIFFWVDLHGKQDRVKEAGHHGAAHVCFQYLPPGYSTGL